MCFISLIKLGTIKILDLGLSHRKHFSKLATFVWPFSKVFSKVSREFSKLKSAFDLCLAENNNRANKIFEQG